MINFFVPSIHHLPTGGNIFNREVINYLSGKARIDVEVKLVDSGEADIAITGTRPGVNSVAVVDSLVARYAHGAVIFSAREIFSRIVIVVHYLHLLDPAHRGSDEIQLERKILEAGDGFVTTSRFSRAALISHGVLPGSVTVVRPGLHERFRGLPKVKALGDTIRLLTVSNFLPGKGMIRLVGILDEMRDKKWTWDVVGWDVLDDGYSTRFKNRLKTSSISSRVRVHGALSRSQLVDVYDRCDLFLLPSRFESCGMVLMEAMARGIPGVAFKVGGIPETVMGSGGVLLIPAGNWRGFGQAVRELVEDRSRRVGMGRMGWETSKRFPSWEAAGQEFMRCLSRDG